MRLPGAARTLLALGALAFALTDPVAGTARAAEPTDPGVALRSSRALAAAMPTGTGTSSGVVRLTANPITGHVCVTTSGVTAAPGVIVALSLSAPDGTLAPLTGDDLRGCSVVAPVEAVDLLAAPATYAVELSGPTGVLATAPLAPAPAFGRPWHVGTRTETVVDRTRGTARRGTVPATHSRVLRLTYFYPDSGAADSLDAPPSPEGPFPVVVFSPGYAVTPQTYRLTLRAWAAAGYVVVGVLSPGSGGGLPGAPTEADLGAQPGDLSLALSTVAAHTMDPSSWLGGVADVNRVAVAGHSDGGSTAAAAGLLKRYSDPRFDAVIVLAGASFGGRQSSRALPLLEITGQRDEYNAPSTFATVFRLGRSTRTWVQAVGARHLPPFVVAGPQASDLRDLEIAFLDRSLLGAPTRASERARASIPGVTQIVAGGF